MLTFTRGTSIFDDLRALCASNSIVAGLNLESSAANVVATAIFA